MRSLNLDSVSTIRLFRGHSAKLERIAEYEGLTKADLIRRAVKVYLENYEKNPFNPELPDIEEEE